MRFLIPFKKAVNTPKRLYLNVRFHSEAIHSDEQKKPIGFLGIGKMGSLMARNLLMKDTSLFIFDTDQSCVTSLQNITTTITTTDEPKQNALSICSSPLEVINRTDVLITMLPNDFHTRKAYLDKDIGLICKAKPGSLLINSSTISIDLAKELSLEAQKNSIQFLDAPVSGGRHYIMHNIQALVGVVGAENATLTFMVGGDLKDFEKAKPTLSKMGKSIFYCGEAGHGQIAKICNNLLLAISMLGACEVLQLGKNLGMDPSLLSNIINVSSGRCWSTEVYNPVPGFCSNAPASKNYEAGFTNKLLAKDLGLAMNAALKSNSTLFLGSTVHELVHLLSETPQYALKDFTSYYQFIERTQTSNKV